MDGDIVPVELVSFEASASGGKVNLNWSTATETNNRGFSIERSSGSEFETIGFVNGSGTTTERRSYSFTDDNVLSGTYTYRLKQIDFDGSFEYSNGVEVNVFSATDFTLAQNFPNPFNPDTQIRFDLPAAVNVRLVVFDLLGREVRTLIDNSMPAGAYHVMWDGRDFRGLPVGTGTYIYRITAGSFSDVHKMLLLK